MFWFSSKRFFLILPLVISLFSFSLTPIYGQDENAENDDPVEIFNQAQNAHEKGDLQTALKLYESALKIAPDFPEAEYQRGTIYLLLNKSEEAEAAFRHAVELRADWSLPIAQLGAVLVRQGKFDEAEPVLNKAVKLDSNNFPAFVALAELRLKTNASEEIRQNLLVQIKTLSDGKSKTPASVWTARASLERSLGDISSAKTSLSRALAMNPKDVPSLLERAELSLKENDFARAADDVKTALELQPNSLNGKILLANIEAASGNTEESLRILDKLGEDEKKKPEVVNLRKTIFLNGLNGAEAVGVLEKTLANEPRNIAVLARLCNLTRTTNPAKSLEYCRRALEIEPNNINHAIGYGAALVQAKQFENAVGVLRRILQFAPDDFKTRANLAAALYELNRFPESITEYDWLIRAKPEIPITYFLKATAHDKIGEYADALAAYQKFLAAAEPSKNQLEIDKVNLRLPILTRQIKNGDGKKTKKS